MTLVRLPHWPSIIECMGTCHERPNLLLRHAVLSLAVLHAPHAVRTALAAVLLLCLPLLEASAAEHEPPTTVEIVTKVRLTADRIEYSGLITAEANAGVFELYESAQPKPTALWIESQGGGAGAGMQLGSWLFENGLDVEVDTYCFSSCANYVFPAGRTKVLAPRASLMWHGGVTQPITPEELELVLDDTLDRMDETERHTLLEQHPRAELLQQLDHSRIDLVARETWFFQQIGVDQRITRLGHLYERELLQDEGDYMGWDYSLEDLAKLGVRQIHVRDGGQWDPVFPVRGGRIYRIRLDSLSKFVPHVPRGPT